MEKSDFRIEHYKSMREEYLQLMLYIQKLWNYKLSTLGAVTVISIFNEKLIGFEKINTDVALNPTLIISIGLLMLPILAFLIDLKIVEIGMQIKLISNHLLKKFSDIEEISEWERNLWPNNSIASIRSTLSLILYVGASLVILVLSFLTVYILQPTWRIALLISGIVLILLPVIAIFTLIPKILK